MGTVRLLVGLTSIYIASLLAKEGERLFGISWDFDSFEQMLPCGLVCVGVGALLSLDPAIGLGLVNELRRLTTSTGTVVLELARSTFLR